MKPRFVPYLILISIVFWMAIAVHGCSFYPTPSLKELQVGMNTWPGYQIALYAQTAGLFQKHGLAVKFVRFNNQQDNIRATMRGTLDASFVPLSEVMQVDPTAEKPVFVLVVDVSHGSDGIVALPGINSVKDLKGKQVSAKLGTVSHLILLEALNAYNIPPEEVDIVDTANEHGIELLKEGKISASVLWEPLLADTAKAIGGTVIHTTANLDSLVIDGLTTRSSILTTKRDELTRFIKAWFEVMEAVETRPQEVFASVAQQIGTTPEIFAEDYHGLKKGDLTMNRWMFTEGRLQRAYEETRELLLGDSRHGKIIRDDIEINAEPITRAVPNW